jgi:hypothetical protein
MRPQIGCARLNSALAWSCSRWSARTDLSGCSSDRCASPCTAAAAAAYNHARIFAELGFFVDFISPQEVRQGRLAEFDIIGMPGGGGIANEGPA